MYILLCKIAKKEKYMQVNMVHSPSTINYNCRSEHEHAKKSEKYKLVKCLLKQEIQWLTVTVILSEN